MTTASRDLRIRDIGALQSMSIVSHVIDYQMRLSPHNGFRRSSNSDATNDVCGNVQTVLRDISVSGPEIESVFRE